MTPSKLTNVVTVKRIVLSPSVVAIENLSSLDRVAAENTSA
jgi:hypothetical protein